MLHVKLSAVCRRCSWFLCSCFFTHQCRGEHALMVEAAADVKRQTFKSFQAEEITWRVREIYLCRCFYDELLQHLLFTWFFKLQLTFSFSVTVSKEEKTTLKLLLKSHNAAGSEADLCGLSADWASVSLSRSLSSAASAKGNSLWLLLLHAAVVDCSFCGRGISFSLILMSPAVLSSLVRSSV